MPTIYPPPFIYLFYLFTVIYIVQCSNALYKLWDGEIKGHTGQPSVREIDAHTMYNQWATAPGRSLNYPRPKSITHLRTFSDNGVYVALQLLLVILVSDQWRLVFNTLLLSTGVLGLLHARGWLSRYTWDQRLYVVSEPRETHSPMLKARFIHLTILAAAGIEPQTFWIPGQRVTTRPWLNTQFKKNRSSASRTVLYLNPQDMHKMHLHIEICNNACANVFILYY